MSEPRLADPRVSELLHAALHAIAEPTGQIHRIAALIARRGNGLDEDVRSWLSHLGSATTRLDESLRAVGRYAEVVDLPHECARFPLLGAVASARNSVSSNPAITTDELPEVETDPKRMELLFHELLSNALKFCAEQTPVIHISAAREGEDFVVSIADNGIGIEPNQTQRIFKPFVRLWGDRFPGAGMGLAIARMLVETWNGRIWVDSVVGSGSTFRFTLPAVNR